MSLVRMLLWNGSGRKVRLPVDIIVAPETQQALAARPVMA